MPFNTMLRVPGAFETASSFRRAGRRGWLWAFAAALMFLPLSIGFSWTRARWWDEGVFADVAMNLRSYGHFGSTLLDPYGYLELPQVNHYTYWQFPAYLIALGTWLQIVPFTIEWIRLFSVLCGCCYIFCWFMFVRCLTRDEPLALFIASVVALDYATVAAASNGRMDMMCAASGQAALASFVCLKDSNRARAMFLAGCFAAVSLFCHPIGAAIPYLIAGALWLMYVAQAPQIFLAQTRAASGYRVDGLPSLFRNLCNDLYLRYFGLYYPRNSGIYRLKVATLVFAVVGTLALASNRRLRSQPLGRSLLKLAAIGYLGVAVIDNQELLPVQSRK